MTIATTIRTTRTIAAAAGSRLDTPASIERRPDDPGHIVRGPTVPARRGILGPVSTATSLEQALEPIRADPARAAVLFDVDGTLAPIVRHADDAHVPEPTRALLIGVSRKYPVTACVSGRRAAIARRIVSIGSISYIGNHGAELLRAGSTEPELEPEFAAAGARVRTFRDEIWRDPRLQRLRGRGEDKGGIAAFHWRGAP